MSQSGGELKNLWQILKPHKPSKMQFAVLSVLVVVTTVLELLIPWFSKNLVDSISVDGVAMSVLMTLLGIVLISAVFEGILTWYGAKTGERICTSLRYSLIGNLLFSKVEAASDKHSAEYATRVVNDTLEVKTVLATDFISLFAGAVSLVAVVAMMFYLDWRLTLVLLACVLVGFLVILPLSLMMSGIGKAIQAAQAKLLSTLTEWMRHHTLIKSHNAQRPLHQESKALLENCMEHEVRGAKIMAMISPTINLVLMMSMVAILGFSSYWMQQGSMTLGTVTAFLMYLFGLTFPLVALGAFFSNLFKAAGTATRLQDIEQLAQEQIQQGESVDNASKIQIQALNFERDEKVILNNVSYQFDGPGLSIVTGESGSGKSTLMSQLLGFYDDTKSAIFIDGKRLDSIDLYSLRQAVAWVDQEPKLLNTSIKENLLLGLSEQPSEGSIEQTLEQVGLSQWYEKIGRDLDQAVSERAQIFSGGEKQRFAIARALLRNAKVLLMDEPTSALDKHNSTEMMTLIRAIAKERRVIMISHNSAFLQQDDDHVHIEEGTIAQSAA